jgi:hypothetical protein
VADAVTRDCAKTLGSRNADAGLVLRFNFSEPITQARSFGAILFSFDTVLDGRDAAHCIHNLGEGIFFALAKIFELVGVIILAQGFSLGFVNLTTNDLFCCLATSR